MSKTRLHLLVLLLAPFAALHGAGSSPHIFNLSDPVLPDETVVITGEDLGKDAVLEISRANGGNASNTVKWTTVKPLQAGPGSVKAVVPPDWTPGIYACRVRVGRAVSNELLANAPAAWWWIGDGGESATPGGWLRVFGKALNFGKAGSKARLCPSVGKEIELNAEKADGYALQFPLPANLAEGDYKLMVNNGLGKEAAWAEAGTVAVHKAAAWKNEVFNIKDFGPNPGEALLSALKKAESNGGGVVFLPRGRYPVQNHIVIPPHTILRGEAMELTSLYWPDMDKPPSELISGTDYGIENLSVYCQNHINVISDTADSLHLTLKKVRIRANCFFLIEDIGKEFRERHGPNSHTNCGAALMLRGRNFEVSDCDIYASNYALHIMKAKVGVITRNRLLYGGRGYSMENTERLVFEGNTVAGNNLLAIGNDITTFWTNYSMHIYYANNHIQQMYGADREMMTLDGGGGAYWGKIASASGTKLTLAADPTFKDYAPKAQIHTNWKGAAVQIMDGTGAGQYRLVTSNTGREWEVDQPWIVPPDTSSRISIAPFRGRNLFIGNTLEDGGPFQIYGAGHDCIVANNRSSRTDGYLIWGLNPHGWGYQPSWNCQFLDNEILEGNSYGHRASGFGTVDDDESKAYDGALVRAAIFRRNTLHNNAGFSIAAHTEDTLLENNSIQNCELGISIRLPATGTLQRGNIFKDVTEPVREK